eukprot:SAG11_NODE_1638_length_4535_cov_3.231740_2_plen_208_part_00
MSSSNSCESPQAIKFYGAELKSAPTLHSGTRPLPPGFAWPRPLWPVCFVDTKGVEAAAGDSYSNDAEAQAVRKVLREVLSHRGSGATGMPLEPIDCCVITPYAGQVTLIKQYCHASRALQDVEINSVDGFQGREKELVVVSAVRANEGGECGFLSDWRRLNVTLTRAKRGPPPAPAAFLHPPPARSLGVQLKVRRCRRCLHRRCLQG